MCISYNLHSCQGLSLLWDGFIGLMKSSVFAMDSIMNSFHWRDNGIFCHSHSCIILGVSESHGSSSWAKLTIFSLGCNYLSHKDSDRAFFLTSWEVQKSKSDKMSHCVNDEISEAVDVVCCHHRNCALSTVCCLKCSQVHQPQLLYHCSSVLLVWKRPSEIGLAASDYWFICFFIYLFF